MDTIPLSILFLALLVLLLLYRFIWWLSFYLSLLCLLYLLIQTFWRYVDQSGGIWAELNRNSYGVYIVHVIVIGVFGTVLLHTSLPAIVKYPALALSTYLFSNLMVSLYRRVSDGIRVRAAPQRYRESEIA